VHVRRLWLLLVLSGSLVLGGCPAGDDDDSSAADDDDTAPDDDDTAPDDDDSSPDDDDSSPDDDDATGDDDDATGDDDDSTGDDDDSVMDDDDSVMDDDDSVMDDDDSVMDDDDSVVDDDDSVVDDDDSVADDDDSAAVSLDWVELVPLSASATTREAVSLTVTAHYTDSSSAAVDAADVSWSTTTASGAPAPLLQGLDLSSITAGELTVTATVDGVDSAQALIGFAAAPIQPGDVVINELLADGTAGDANDDGFTDAGEDAFVEFVNISGIELDLNGARLYDDDLDLTVSARHTFGFGDVFPPEEVLVVFGGGSPAAAPVHATFVVADNANDPGIPLLLALNPAGDAVRLRAADDTLLAEVEFGTVAGGSPDANIDESINLDPDVIGTDYAPHTDVSGDPNVVFSPGALADLTPF
jgi:hypothetical protein